MLTAEQANAMAEEARLIKSKITPLDKVIEEITKKAKAGYNSTGFARDSGYPSEDERRIVEELRVLGYKVEHIEYFAYASFPATRGIRIEW